MNRQSKFDRREEESELDEDGVSIDGMLDNADRFPELVDSPVGFVQVDIERDGSPDDSVRSQERLEDTLTVGVDPDLIMDTMRDHSGDPDVLDDFTERQGLGSSDRLLDTLRRHNSKSPGISGEDLDADWERADQVGEETVGGTVVTPDQDVVEELGEALGIKYEDDEPLATEDKLAERELHRWELDPASADDDDSQEPDELYERVAHLTKLGLLDDEDLAELDEDELEALVDELDDDVIEDDDNLDDEIDDMDDDFLLGGVDEED